MTEVRQYSIELPDAISDADRQELLDTLGKHDAVEEIHVDRRTLHISYRFPDLSLAAVWRELGSRWGDVFPLITRIRNGLRVMMEQNERNHLSQRYGWHDRIENIYARRYEQYLHGSSRNRKQQWRDYADRKRGPHHNSARNI